ncbi:MAG: aldo/keto reductase [Opitutae bacterium]|jgi:aryl-alcohol dehydrogenase-like predicted oxidoreductase|nr:aldo/keto reductase [Opitutae bacterium]
MKKNKLGDSDLMLSEIGLGTWAIGGGDWGMGWGRQDENDSIASILEALDQGINWIDTAHAYGFGVAETAVGKALKEFKDDEVIVATKCGVLPEEDNKPIRFISRKTILEEVDGSLRRLGRDYIDLYQIHWPVPAENLVESWETLQELKKIGKIRWAGVCNCWERELEELQKIAPITSNQPMYSMLERKIEHAVLPWAEKHNSGVVVYSPMHSGLLTGKISVDWLEKLPLNDWRKHKTDHPVVSPLHSKDGLQAFLILQNELRLIAVEKGMTVGQLAVCWALNQSMVTSAIVGARKSGQILETVKASEKTLSPDETNLIMKHIINFEKKLNHGG